MPKDWTGNSTSVYANLAASNHSGEDRADKDYYATPPMAVEELLKREEFNHYILEPAVGGGHIADVLTKHGHVVQAMDIIDRGYNGTKVRDFLTTTKDDLNFSPDIITNPPYKCFDTETECYTKRGWMKIKDVLLSDEVLSVNPYTLELSWSEINSIIIRPFDPNTEKMYHFKHNNMDIMCTDKHRMFAYRRETGTLYQIQGDLATSEHIRSTHYMPTHGYCWNGEDVSYFILPQIFGNVYAQPTIKPEIKIPMDDWLRFFGLWLADGYCRHTKNVNGNLRKTVGIKQRTDNADSVRCILNKLPFGIKEYKDSYNRKNPCINFEIHNEQLWHYLIQFGKSDTKYIPYDIKNLSCRQLMILIDAYYFGDGSKYQTDGRIYRSTSKQLMEDVQEILFKLGHLTTVIQKQYTVSSGDKHDLYSITANPNSQYNNVVYPSNKNDMCQVEYVGDVCCLNLKTNGVFLLRRNNIPFISGNCASEFVEHALDISMDSVKVAMLLKIQFLETKKRYDLFKKYPPKKIYVFVNRIDCGKNGEFGTESSAVCYAWFVWEKGYDGLPQIDWICSDPIRKAKRLF